VKNYYFQKLFFFLVHAVKNIINCKKKFLIFCSSFIEQQIFYNGDPGNFGTTLHLGYRLYYT